MSTSSSLDYSGQAVAPQRIIRAQHSLSQLESLIQPYGQRPLVVGGDQSLARLRPYLSSISSLAVSTASYGQDCSETSMTALSKAVSMHQADVVVGVGGGKALDAAKLLAYQHHCPVITIPTSAATCAAWTALSNLYSEAGAFQYDVGLPQCPDLLILDYEVIQTAPPRTLIAGIGDALAKWYEASVSSGHSQETLTIAAVQQARVLRDILFQKSAVAIAQPGGEDWQQVVDATVLMAGVVGGLGGAQCRTVAAHAVHNGLTHLTPTRSSLHGEKVAYGILVQLRLEELIQNNHLATTARHQLLKFYGEIGLPMTLADLGMADVSLKDLQTAAQVACQPDSDLHHLPFTVTPDQLMAAMVSTASLMAGSSANPIPSSDEVCP
ncbi:iron-containing alcohol dehydrogenase family protein [Acaryochloris sp. IP29b_bin.148]|uniref:iron-containing alcohol dehydrogenase family protein n=1 Tax=Acaryochloris sp. IP29b_bin.148 TaxID=2969218 RepID=UPI002628DCEC|nr:iron-containing alcohol dehydrogenase family protein [Acaryochloris sp. IP29b_bin.148]